MFGNYLVWFVFLDKVDYLDVKVDLIVGIELIDLFNFFFEEYVEEFLFVYELSLEKDFFFYLEINY